MDDLTKQLLEGEGEEVNRPPPPETSGQALMIWDQDASTGGYQPHLLQNDNKTLMIDGLNGFYHINESDIFRSATILFFGPNAEMYTHKWYEYWQQNGGPIDSNTVMAVLKASSTQELT